MSPRTTANLNTAATSGPPPAIARIETDRCCDGCGYNLHMQGVFRDPGTQLLVCRCPECGRIHAVADAVTAGQAWLRRLGTVLLLFWILFALGVVAGFIVLHGVVTVGTLDELTHYAPATPSGAPPSQLTLPDGRLVTYQVAGTWQRQVRSHFKYRTAFIALLLSLAACLGFCMVGWIAVTMHHWRRWGYLIPALVVPLGVGGFVWWAWSQTAPELSEWAIPYVVGLTLANLVGGVAAVYFGRSVARWLVTLVLSPRARQALAFLWTADGHPPPGMPMSRVS